MVEDVRLEKHSWRISVDREVDSCSSMFVKYVGDVRREDSCSAQKTLE